MPENRPVTPLLVEIVATTTDKVAKLALVAVKLLNEGDVEEAKRVAALCDEGQALLTATAATLSGEDRATLASEIRRRATAKYGHTQ